MKDNFYDDLEAGNEYLDYIAPTLINIGLIFCPHLSKSYQKRYGESVNGIEVKYDRQFVKTNNLFIETEFNSSPSGINYGGNLWIYCIGDYRFLYVFATKGLQRIAQNYQLKTLNKTTGEVKGFCLPKDQAEKFCLKEIIF